MNNECRVINECFILNNFSEVQLLTRSKEACGCKIYPLLYLQNVYIINRYYYNCFIMSFS